MVYRIVYGVFYAISLLPFWVLYGLADAMYLVLYRVMGYRLKVTRANLLQAFPEKTAAERLAIEKEFYKNLCDSIVETVKLCSISMNDLCARIPCNSEVLQTMETENRNGMILFSHQFNWEWGTVVGNVYSPRRFTGMYMPLTNSNFEKLFRYLRSRAGTRLLKVQDMQKELGSLQQGKILWGFIADQNPSDPKRVSWNDFLGKKTAFSKGPDMVARRYNNLVYWGEIIKERRGHYRIQITPVYNNAGNLSDGELTEAYVRFLEKNIRQYPANWLWSHRRWKHEYPANQQNK